jgi:hypothetical protein
VGVVGLPGGRFTELQPRRRSRPPQYFSVRCRNCQSRSCAAIRLSLERRSSLPWNLATATRSNQIAEDGAENSPFAAALLAHLQIPGLELGRFFRGVRDTVLRATNNRQEPYIFSSLGVEPFYFNPRSPEGGPIRSLEAPKP